MNLYSSKIDSPLGDLNLAATNKGICMLEFDNEKRIKHHLSEITRELNCKIIIKENSIIKDAEKQLTKYFTNNLNNFNLPLHLVGTDFQQKVWEELLKIPFGKTRTYKEQAIAMGNLKAIRAVANANGQNRISIIIPCHRVIGSNGNLTGYGGKLWRKEELLKLESNQLNLFN